MLPLQKRRKKRGGGRCFSYAEGGRAQTVLGYAVARSLSHTEGGYANIFHALKKKMGAQKVYPVLRGGGAKRFGSAIFPFCGPPLPVFNYQPLSRHSEFPFLTWEL